ncbi:MAG: hypothetical protein JWN04_3541 [Myxococcaceae bacterium]|nr:hypothetical protein [Myxococcaceae bacterium]
MTKQEATHGIDILAKTVFRDLKSAGYCRADIVAFASNILGHLTSDAKQSHVDGLAAPSVDASV